MSGRDDDEAAGSLKESPAATFLYFDGTSNCGYHNGIVNVTMVVNRYLAQTSGQVAAEAIAVSHLRCTVSAAKDLRDALDKAILMATSGPSDYAN